MADWWTIWENSLNPGEASTKSSHILITRIPNCTSYHTGYLIKPKRTRQPIFQYKNPMSYHTVPKHTSMLVHIMTPHHTNNNSPQRTIVHPTIPNPTKVLPSDWLPSDRARSSRAVQATTKPIHHLVDRHLKMCNLWGQGGPHYNIWKPLWTLKHRMLSEALTRAYLGCDCKCNLVYDHLSPRPPLCDNDIF